MRDWAVWYRKLFTAWLAIGLPSLVIGYGFSGGDFALPDGELLSTAVWLLCVLFILSPIALWRWRRDGRKPGF
jgi:hypothetical protein